MAASGGGFWVGSSLGGRQSIGAPADDRTASERTSGFQKEMGRDCSCGRGFTGRTCHAPGDGFSRSGAIGNGACLFRSLVKVDRTEPAYRTPSIEAPPAHEPPETGPPLSPVRTSPTKKSRLVVIDRPRSVPEEKTGQKQPPNFPGLVAPGIPRSPEPGVEIAVWAAAFSTSLEANQTSFWLNWRRAHSDGAGFCPEQNGEKMVAKSVFESRVCVPG